MSLEAFGGGSSSGSGMGSGEDPLAELFYPLYRLLFDENSDFVADIETKLGEARMADTVEMYISRSLGLGVVSGLLLWLVGVTIGYGLFATGIIDVTLGMPAPNATVAAILETLRVPTMIIATGLVFGSIGFGIGFGTLIAIPYSRASARAREINMLLADAVAFMYALSVGGLNQLEILEAMAQAEDTYGEVAKEFQSLVQETEYFDTDYRTAVRKQAMETPSDELAQFLTDMLSIINSGGDMENFLDEKKEKHMRTAKQQQELTLETLELFGEMYMTLSMFPLLLVIIMVTMALMGNDTQAMLLGTIYGLLPMLGVGFMVMVSSVKQDEPGDGFLNPPGGDDRLMTTRDSGILNLGYVETFIGEYSIFERIKSREGTYETVEILKAPHIFFRDNPLYTLAMTVPTAFVVVVGAIIFDSAPTTVDGMIANPVWSTFIYVYVPAYITVVPLAIFREWNVIARHRVINNLSDDLRKLSSANDTGQTLLESTRTVADTSSGKLAQEFEIMHAKVKYGMSLRDALIEFNNKYHIPRLARTVKLIGKAQEASSQITQVLSTAAQSSENQDDIARERKSRTRMQVVIIMMTFLTLLAVMAILQTQFIEVMAGLTEETAANGDTDTGDDMGDGPGGDGFGEDIDTDLLSLLFFHAVTMQGILSGMISGYMRDGQIMSGLKYVVILMTITLVVWVMVA